MWAVLAALLLYAPPSEPESPSAQRAYDEGIAAYETSDFSGAIESFSRAFSLAAEIEDPTKRGLAMNRLRFNLARAHLGAWTIDRQVEHLRTAQSLVEAYREEERREGRDPDADVELKGFERELNTAMSATGGPGGEGEGEGASDPTRPASGPTPSSPDVSVSIDRSRTPIVVGSVLTGAGGLSLGMMAVALAQGQASRAAYLNEPTADGRSQIDRQGNTWNVVAGVAGGVGAGLVVAGVAALAVGIKRRRTAVSPTVAFGRGHLTLGLGGRF